MTAIPTPVLIITAQILTKAGKFVNVSYWQGGTAPTSSADCDNIGNGFSSQFGPLYGDVLHTSASYFGCRVVYLNGSLELAGADSTSTAGTLTGTAVSDQNAWIIRKITAQSGRAARGRYFVGGMSNLGFDTDDPDLLNQGDVTRYQALAAAYGADGTWGASTWHARHWNRKTSTLMAITNCKISSRIASRDDRRRHAPDFAE